MIACLRHPQLTEDPLLDPLHAASEPTDSADYTSAPTVTRRMSAWGTEVKAPILSDGKKSSSSKSSRSSSGQAKSRRSRHPRGARAQCAGARPAGTDARRGSRSPSACRAGARLRAGQPRGQVPQRSRRAAGLRASAYVVQPRGVLSGVRPDLGGQEISDRIGPRSHRIIRRGTHAR